MNPIKHFFSTSQDLDLHQRHHLRRPRGGAAGREAPGRGLQRTWDARPSRDHGGTLETMGLVHENQDMSHENHGFVMICPWTRWIFPWQPGIFPKNGIYHGFSPWNMDKMVVSPVIWCNLVSLNQWFGLIWCDLVMLSYEPTYFWGYM